MEGRQSNKKYSKEFQLDPLQLYDFLFIFEIKKDK